MYALSLSAAAAEGFHLDGIPAERINLYHANATVPIAFENLDDAGKVRPDTRIIFWGEYPRGESTRKNPYTQENPYFLEWNSRDAPNRFRPIAGGSASATGTEPTVVRTTRHIEQDLYLAHYQHYAGPPTDRVMWAAFKSPPQSNPKNAVTFDLSDLGAQSGATATLKVLLWGSSDLPDPLDHHWSVRLNGTEIGQAEWDGITAKEFASDPFPQNLLMPRGNSLSFVSLREGTDPDAILLDGMEITYDAVLSSEDGQIEAGYPEESGRQLVVGSGSENPHLYTNAGETLIPQGIGGHRFAISLPDNLPARRLRIADPSLMPAPERVLARHDVRLPAQADSLDYLIITHSAFVDALKPLIALRESQGLRCAMIDVEDIYDAHAAGLFSAAAIRAYLDTLLSAPDPTLKYLFLVGDASFDYFALRGKDENFVPTWHETPNGDFALPDYCPTVSVDDAFVYPPTGEPVPRVAVGRLPAHSVEAVESYVQKVLEYETQPEPRRARTLLVAAHGFEPTLDQLARQPYVQKYENQFMHGAGNEEADADFPQRMIGAFDSGIDLLYFVGHGASYMWRTGPNAAQHKSDVLTSRHVPLLSNHGRYPIVFAATCFSTLFDAPLYRKSYSDSGVGIHLVEAPRAGAIAVIGHTSKTPVGIVDLFSRDVMQHLALPAVTRLGDAYLYAKQHNELRANPLTRGIALIGDPGLFVGTRFQRPES